MGTRNLTKVVDANGVTKVAQYGQWDGYPSGQGLNVLRFLQDYRTLGVLEMALEKCRFVESADIPNLKDTGDFIRDENLFQAYYPNFSRNTGSDILKVITFSTGDVDLIDESEFENDGLFCEGVYEVNYQTKEFISKYDGKTRHVPFTKLSNITEEQYLELFEGESDEETATQLLERIYNSI